MFDFDTFITNRFLLYHCCISDTHSWMPSCSLSMLLAAQYRLHINYTHQYEYDDLSRSHKQERE